MSLRPTTHTEPTPKSQQAAVNGSFRAICRACGRVYQRVRANQLDCPDCKGPKTRIVAWAHRHQTELFPNPSTALDRGRADRDQAHVDPLLVDKLVKLLREYARSVPEVDMGAFRIWLDRRGIELPEHRNFLGRLPIMAGLTRTNQVTQSAHPSAKGRIVRIWRLSE